MQKIKTLFIAGTFVALGAIGNPVLAQATMDPSKMGDVKLASAAEAAGEMSDAEVRKIDKEQGKVTLKHGPIKNLDMPGMTMVFTVKDKAMLDGFKPGDKVKFTAVDENGRMTVTQMTQAK